MHGSGHDSGPGQRCLRLVMHCIPTSSALDGASAWLCRQPLAREASQTMKCCKECCLLQSFCNAMLGAAVALQIRKRTVQPRLPTHAQRKM